MAVVHWHPKSVSAMNRLIVRSNPGIGAATLAEAEVLGAIAEGIMAPHHANSAARRAATGATDPPSRITVTQGSGGVDAFVNLEAESRVAAASIENETHALHGAMGLGSIG